MIRLGHIDYSNCIPAHALLLDSPPAGIELVHGVPAALNRALAEGSIDAAPCSSIEYARHVGAYRILPHHAIGAVGAVQSILLESRVPLSALHDRPVAVPTASATSVVLLRALLELRLDVRPRYVWFDQAAVSDPLDEGAAAALRIGDVALAREPIAGRRVFDLGAEWHDWTALPFAFAVWQVRRDVADERVARLVRLLAESRAWFDAHAERLAERHAAGRGIGADRLLAYWRSLRLDLDPAMIEGLLHFYDLAARLGEAPAAVTLDIVDHTTG
ncbi:MAG: menaquinone biosynthesis protein [Gemmatimonadota bacterium]